ncbi:MAG: MotA/TolQ/ExbB proton channel family protein [Lentisphaeria bacterium]|nr:MotA/TolQ/ExbB proton channel family protein [Lentisphaeria bacterium]
MEFEILNWKKVDPEAKWGIRAKKFTAVSNWFSLVWGIVLTVIFYGVLYPFHMIGKWQMVNMFFHGGVEKRSSIPYFTMLLGFWCLAFLIIKLKKIKAQKKALELELIPDSREYIISPMNAQEIISGINKKVHRGCDFLVLNRIECALENLRNIGRVADVSSLLKDLAAADTDASENTYTLPQGLIWAIPVLGFIGTVLGLSEAVGGFGAVVAGGADLDALKGALGGVTGGLATAFETTLIALVIALVIQLLMTLVRQKEEEFLEACSTYCYKNLTAHLKMIDIDESLEYTAAEPAAEQE